VRRQHPSMSQSAESSDAIETHAGRSAIGRSTRVVRRMSVATSTAIAAGVLISPVAELAFFVGFWLAVASIWQFKRLRRIRSALSGHQWRNVDLARIGSSLRWQATENGSRQCYVLPTTFPPRLFAAVAGPSHPKPWRRQFSAVMVNGRDDLKIVRGPRPPESFVTRSFRMLPIFAGREIVTRPAVMHDLPSGDCRLGPAGLTVLPGDGSTPTELVMVMRAKRPVGSCELWLNGGDRIGEVARDKGSFGLLDPDGDIVVESEQRFGLHLYGTGTTCRVASARRDTLVLGGRTLTSTAQRTGYVLESSRGVVVARALQTSKSRRQTTVVVSISTKLAPIERAIVLLRLCTLVDVPGLPVVSS
jgi:hypothetical protein